MTRMEALEAVAEAARDLVQFGNTNDRFRRLSGAIVALGALPAASEPEPARGEVVEVAVWENINGDYFFIKPGRNSMGYGWTRLGTTRLPLTVEAPR